MKYLLVLSALLVGCAQVEPRGERPTRAEVEKVERMLTLPAGTAPLGAYRRVYWLDDGKITGLFTRWGEPGIEIVDAGRAPGLADGGCDVVNVVYEPSEDRVLQVSCNGEA